MRHVKTAFTQAAAIAAVLGLELGRSWLTVGYGLHPVLAGALFVALIVWPYLIEWRAR